MQITFSPILYLLEYMHMLQTVASFDGQFEDVHLGTEKIFCT